MAVIDWPCELVRALDVSYFIQWTSREAGANLMGVPQIVTPGIGLWRVDVTIPREFDGARIKALEAKVSQMRGRYNVARLCVCDPYRYSSAVSPQQTPFSDGTWFSDGTGFAENSVVQALVTTAAVAAGANQLAVQLSNPARPQLRIGDMFSVSGFLYRVVDTSGATVFFEPSARIAIPAGTTLQTDPPVIQCRFIDDSQGMRTRELLRWGSQITLSFVEAFDR